MGYIILDNKISQDVQYIRSARLSLIEEYIGELAPDLTLPGDLLMWCGSCGVNWEAALSTSMIEWGEKEEAFQTWSEAALELRERYGFIKELLLARYTEYDEKKSIYGIDDDTPQIDKKGCVAISGSRMRPNELLANEL